MVEVNFRPLVCWTQHLCTLIINIVAVLRVSALQQTSEWYDTDYLRSTLVCYKTGKLTDPKTPISMLCLQLLMVFLYHYCNRPNFTARKLTSVLFVTQVCLLERYSTECQVINTNRSAKQKENKFDRGKWKIMLTSSYTPNKIFF